MKITAAFIDAVAAKHPGIPRETIEAITDTIFGLVVPSFTTFVESLTKAVATIGAQIPEELLVQIAQSRSITETLGTEVNMSVTLDGEGLMRAMEAMGNRKQASALPEAG